MVAETAELPPWLKQHLVGIEISFPTAAIQSWQKVRAVVFADCTRLATTSHFVADFK